tara:strand:+ start:12082 stop:12858 length:777 start_codon:yes stop_codon:yes gene_type:complete
VVKDMIVIAGYGYVGRAVHSVFPKAKIVDPKYNNNSIGGWWNKPSCVIICVNTPTKNGICDPSNVLDVLKNCPRNVPILIKSTISLHAWDQIQAMFDKRFITFSPEFLTSANPIEAFRDQGIMYVGGGDTKFWIKKFSDIFTVSKESPRALITAKLFRNAYLATKVTFFNQLYTICEKEKLDYNTVNSLVCADKRIGHSHSLVPGDDGHRGFGGVCLPKDIQALASTHPDDLSLLMEVIRINKTMREIPHETKLIEKW